VVAEEIDIWRQRMGDEIAEELLASAFSPDVVKVTEKEAAEFYRRNYAHLLWMPDGWTPNEEGRAAVIAQHGIDAYIAICEAFLEDAKERDYQAPEDEEPVVPVVPVTPAPAAAPPPLAAPVAAPPPVPVAMGV
jgi:hypothetical protein